MKQVKIPEATIGRLSFYSRFLTKLENDGIETVSSGEIAKGIAGNSAQVRKDFAYFGGFGKRGVGYNVADLNRNIKEILGLNREWKAVIVGMGNLGRALAYYHGFAARGFRIIGLFDNNPSKKGEKINNLEIQDASELENFLEKNPVDIAILTLPGETVQFVVDRVVKKGVKGILNFAPVVVFTEKDVQVRNVDLSVNLEILSYNLNSK
ncbi:MAG: redox-sensing transcriptional repressor Rex [Clostridia bacterium]|nr:redox-sensing transcriptional repressor Rex [Clostridia bacterium]